jgi:Ser/Thr protein kinase RdoA (MazF antagonist)
MRRNRARTRPSRGSAGNDLLAFEASSSALDGRVLRVFSYLEGESPHTIVDDSAKRARFLGQLGEAVARLHRIAMPEFSSRIGTSGGFERWSDYVANRWVSVVGRAEQSGLDADLVAAAGAAVDRLAPQFDDVARPALCHRDLYLDNLLCDREGNLVALLDFDMAEAWEPAADFHKLRWLVFEGDAGAERALLSGYCDGHRLPDYFDARVLLVEIIDLVNGLAGWLARGDTVITVSAAARLRHLLAA